MGPKNHLRIDENTQLTLEQNEEPKQKKKEVIIQLLGGTLRSKLNGLEKNQSFTIRTPTAVGGCEEPTL